MTNTNENNQNKDSIQTPGKDKSPEQLRLEKDKADQAAKHDQKDSHKDSHKDGSKEEVKKV
jgi:hypothetical protein